MNENLLPRRIAIIGFGLLGGSVAMAYRRALPQANLVACARKESTRAFALRHGLVDHATENLADAVSQSDLVVIATPTDLIAEYVLKIGHLNPDTFLTDVGSTKNRIVQQISTTGAAEDDSIASRFFAAHPIAGSEKTGAEHARQDLFDERTVVVTPSGLESQQTRQIVQQFWEACGANVVEMPPHRHDELLAQTSHVPHLMASLIAGQMTTEAEALVGSGWRDTTRVAAGDPDLWLAIVRENRAAILDSLTMTQNELGHLVELIRDQDDSGLRTWLAAAQSKRRRVTE